MLIVTRKKETHILFSDVQNCKSLSSLLLLTDYFKSQDTDFLNSEWMKRVLYNTNFLKHKIKEDGKLTCVFCQKDNLYINEDYTKEPSKKLLATVDHLIPRSKGGEEFNYNNLVVSCWDCNTKKGNKIGKIIENKYSY